MECVKDDETTKLRFKNFPPSPNLVLMSCPSLVHRVLTVQFKFILYLNRFPYISTTSYTSLILPILLLLLIHSSRLLCTRLLVYSLLIFLSTTYSSTLYSLLPTLHSLLPTIYSPLSALHSLFSVHSICFDQLSLSIIRLIRTLFALGERKHHSVCLSIICECYPFHRAAHLAHLAYPSPLLLPCSSPGYRGLSRSVTRDLVIFMCNPHSARKHSACVCVCVCVSRTVCACVQICIYLLFLLGSASHKIVR